MRENSAFTLGYLICAIFVFVVYIAANYYPVYAYYGSSFYLLVLFSYLLNTVFITSLVAVAAMPRFRKTSFVVLLIAGIVMLPFSTLMLYGLMRRNAQLRFRNLTEWKGSASSPQVTTQCCYATKTPFIGGCTLFSFGVVNFFTPTSILGFFAAPIGFIILVNIIRLRNKISLGFDSGKLIITPTFFSDTYSIPLTDSFFHADSFSVTPRHFNVLLYKELELTLHILPDKRFKIGFDDYSIIIEQGNKITEEDFLTVMTAMCEKAGIAEVSDTIYLSGAS